MRYDRRRPFSILILATLCVAAIGCSRDKAETLPTTRIKTSLGVLPKDSVVTLASGDTLHVSRATTKFYRQRRGRAAWVGTDGPIERGEALMNAIGNSEEDGLTPLRYRYDIARKLLAAIKTEGDAELADSTKANYLADLDLLLTEGFNRYSNDLVTGTLDPQEAGIDWRIKPGAPNEQIVLANIIKGMEPQRVVQMLRPSIPQYERLRHALSVYHKAQTRGGWPEITSGAKLKEGARDPSVWTLRQRFLLGTDSIEASLAQTGRADSTLFDGNLTAAIKHFQERHAIEPDGKLGESTLRELNHSIDERIAEIKLNLDRWRWLPDNLGDRYVMVNIAGFELEMIDKGKVIEAMNVVVGKPSWATPVMADTIENIVANPYWNVPENIANDEVIPAIQRDPGYLASHNMEFVDGRYRQRPGPQNALGQVKILFPNKDDVYLHDTPQDELFSRSRRDFSHGCIRLERPLDLARLIIKLQTRKGDPSVLDKKIATGRESWISVKKLPVYLLYFTSWAGTDGTVYFYHDIYGKDEKLAPQQNKLVRAGEQVPVDAAADKKGQDAALAN
jgi:L,D-transpeptidase YcbB